MEKVKLPIIPGVAVGAPQIERNSVHGKRCSKHEHIGVLMYSVVAMSDADSESEYSDHLKGTTSGRAQLPPKRRKAMRKRQKRKTTFQGTQRQRKYLSLGIATLVTLSLLVIFILINNNNNTSSTPWECKTSIALLNWQSDKMPRLNPNCSDCTITVRNTTLLKDPRSYGAVVLNSTFDNILNRRDRINVNPNDTLIIFGTNKPLQLINTPFTQSNLHIYDKIFSYSLKSDFIWQSYKIVRRNDSRVMAPTLHPDWDAPKPNFVSNASRSFFYETVSESSPLALAILNRPCQPERKELIERISESMDVHTYGDCGEYSWHGNSIPSIRGNRTYKFFLAFEEELCEDYVGEGFFKALSGRLLPVVFGGANYTRFAPPNSYINARDYASMRELAEYLLYLDQNPEEHIKYFTWLDWYRIKSNEFELQEIYDYLDNAARDTDITLDTLKARNTTIVHWLVDNMCVPYQLPEAWYTGASD